MQSIPTPEATNKPPLKKEWLKPDIEIISNVVESGLSSGSFEHVKTVHITGPTGTGTLMWAYHS
jgi:hypothetical protein